MYVVRAEPRMLAWLTPAIGPGVPTHSRSGVSMTNAFEETSECAVTPGVSGSGAEGKSTEPPH